MRTALHIIMLLAVAFALLSCGTVQAHSRKHFLISHGFHLSDPHADIYSRHYDTLGDASRDLGFSPAKLFIPPNGPPGPAPDVRIVVVNGWGFVVTADGKGSLDELNTPCTVGAALVEAKPKRVEPEPLDHVTKPD